VSELLCPLPAPPPVAAVPRGARGGSGHNSTGTITVHGARYKLRQSGSVGPAQKGKATTDASKLGRSGVGFLFLDTVFLPLDVYVDTVGTADTFFFVAGGVALDPAILAETVFALLGEPALPRLVEGTRWQQRATASANLAKALGTLTAGLGALAPPDTSNVAKWPQLKTYKPVKQFGELAGLGALLDAALNTNAHRPGEPVTYKLSAQRLAWLDAAATTRDVTLHRKLAPAVTGTDFAPMTVFSGARGAVEQANGSALAENSLNFEARLSAPLQPVDPPRIAQGLFANFTSLLGDIMPGTQGSEMHGRFVRKAEAVGIAQAVKARFEVLLDEVDRALDPARFNDTMYLRFPFHHKRLYLEGLKPMAPSEGLGRAGWA
jgi:hypothetical protein